MLKKENRLQKNRHFQYVYKKGDKVYSKNLFVVFVATKMKKPKIGFVVNNKIGDAVVRNKVKRRLREIIRLNIEKISFKYNYVIFAKSGIENLEYDELSREVMRCFTKGNLINEGN